MEWWEEQVPDNRLRMKANGKAGLKIFVGDQEDTGSRLYEHTVLY